MFVLVVFIFSLSSAEVTSSEQKSTGTVDAQTDPTELARRLKNVHQCKDKVWPNNKLGDFPMYHVDYDSKPRVATGVDPKTGKASTDIDPEAANNLKTSAAMPFNTRIPPKEKQGVAINANLNMGGKYFDTPLCPKEVNAYEAANPVNPGTSDPYDLQIDVLTHEAYHSVDQDPKHSCNSHNPSGWPAVSGGREAKGSEEDKLTISYYRANIMHFLTKAAKNRGERSTAIAEALLWYRELAAKFPQAIKDLSAVDRREGTASYVGSYSAALGKLGCGASQEAIKEEMLKNSHHRLRDVPMDHDRQAYGLGTLAGLLLDEQGYSGWKKDVMNGKTPLEVLNSTAKGLPKRSPTVVDSIVKGKKLFEAAQSCVKKEALKPIQAAYTNTEDYIAVSVPVPNTTKVNGSPISYENRSWSPSISFDASAKLNNWPTTTDTSNKCQQGHRMIVLIPKSSLRADGSFEYSAGGRSVSGSVGGSSFDNGVDSFDLYCGQ